MLSVEPTGGCACPRGSTGDWLSLKLVLLSSSHRALYLAGGLSFLALSGGDCVNYVRERTKEPLKGILLSRH